METYQTLSISNNIRHVYRKRLLSPFLYLVILTVFWLTAPVSALVFPRFVSSPVSVRELHGSRFTYITTTLTSLHFTGYTQKYGTYTNGYYYYTFQGGQCILVLLAPDSCEEGLSDIEEITIRVRVIRNFEDYETLTADIAKDLNWTASGIRSQVPDYLLSEPGFNKPASMALLIFFFFSGIYALLHFLSCAACILFPALSPACRRLGRYGSPKELLAQAEKELTAKPLLSTEELFLTQHFLIILADSQTAIIPVQEITWIYKHSALHKFLWYHFSISDTLHITARKHLHLQYPNHLKSDIDSIIDYLCEVNPNILSGFNEKNRRLIQNQ